MKILLRMIVGSLVCAILFAPFVIAYHLWGDIGILYAGFFIGILIIAYNIGELILND